MKNLCLSLFCFVLPLFSTQVFAHIDWSDIDGVDCSSRKCQLTPPSIQPGSTITVVYDVQIVHGDPVSILFIHDGDTYTLRDNLPETAGLNTTTVTIPYVECDACTLNVTAAGYTGLANVNLAIEQTTITENAAPVVLLDITQDGSSVDWIDTEKGTVWVKSQVMDMNDDDTHSYDWSGTDNRLLDESAEDQTMLSFDPSMLAEGSYTVQLMVSDDGEPMLSDVAEVSLMVSIGPKSEVPTPTEPTPSKKGGSIDWTLLMLGLACAFYCLVLYVYSIRKERLQS